MAEFGTIQGLAVPMQFDQRINDLRYHQEALQRAKAMSEAKAKLFSDDMDYQNAVNSFDNGIIKQNSQNQIKKIGAFVRENPDWSTNIDKRMQLNQLKRELRDNTDLHRGLASDTAYKTYLADMAEVAKNPQQHDSEAYKQVADQWKNYLRFGNQLGEEAAKTQGKQAFLYNKPRDFADMDKIYQGAGGSYQDVVRQPIKGGRNAYEMVPREESLNAVANQIYAQNKRQLDVEAARKGIDPITMVKQGMNAYIKKPFSFGDYGLSDAMTMENRKLAAKAAMTSKPDSAFQDAFVNIPKGTVGHEDLEQTFGPKPSHFIYDNNGKKLDNTGNRVYYTGNHQTVEIPNDPAKPKGPSHKQKLVETYTYLPLNLAKDKGILEDPFGFSGSNGTDFEVNPEWNQNAEIETTENDKGDKIQRVKVKSFMPVELNSYYAGKFNNQAHIAKSKLMADRPEEGGSDLPTGTAADFKASGWSDAQIEEGVSSGKIRVK